MSENNCDLVEFDPKEKSMKRRIWGLQDYWVGEKSVGDLYDWRSSLKSVGRMLGDLRGPWVAPVLLAVYILRAPPAHGKQQTAEPRYAALQKEPCDEFILQLRLSTRGAKHVHLSPPEKILENVGTQKYNHLSR
jgi:hypothetical protein